MIKLKELRVILKRVDLNDTKNCNRSSSQTKIDLETNVNKLQNLELSQKRFYCDICEKSYTKRSSLKSHKQIHKVNDLKCDYCGITFNYSKTLKRHIAEVHLKIERKNFSCDLCDRKFKEKFLIESHMINVHLRESIKDNPLYGYCRYCSKYYSATIIENHIEKFHQKFECSVCNKVFFKLNSFKRHQKTHIIQKYTCDICKKTYGKLDRLKLHIKSIHLRETTKCKICDKKISLSEIWKHMRRVHKREKNYFCDLCHYNCEYPKKLRVHISAVHLNEPIEKNFACDTCKKSFLTSPELIIHIKSVHLKEQAKCSICDKMLSLSWLPSHIKYVHMKEKKYSCDLCHYKCEYPKKLRAHISGVHLKNRNYTCKICQKSFPNSTNLAFHIKSIHENKKSKCTICDKILSLSGLRNHMKIVHRKEKKYACEMCDFKFAFPGLLKDHISRVHLNEFKHTCDICKKAFKTVTTMNRHRRNIHQVGKNSNFIRKHMKVVHTKDTKYSCDICDSKFTFASRLSDHISRVHLKDPRVAHRKQLNKLTSHNLHLLEVVLLFAKLPSTNDEYESADANAGPYGDDDRLLIVVVVLTTAQSS
uniref:CSON003984 protein n=1 Tax=Culicoides sonorensis TaxID=179676 RepID=A0A336MQC0_CULSO